MKNGSGNRVQSKPPPRCVPSGRFLSERLFAYRASCIGGSSPAGSVLLSAGFDYPQALLKKTPPQSPVFPRRDCTLPTNAGIRAHFLASKRTVGSGQFQPMNSLPASNACQMTAHGGWPPEQMPPLQRAEEVAAILVRAILRTHAAAEKDLAEANWPVGFSVPQRGNSA